jgi:hypothetical protein
VVREVGERACGEGVCVVVRVAPEGQVEVACWEGQVEVPLVGVTVMGAEVMVVMCVLVQEEKKEKGEGKAAGVEVACSLQAA